jgi:hypothetical protein
LARQSREEDEAVALVRVYCGLASADTVVTSNGGWLTAAVVDDSGRLLDVCEIGDDANGYATLSALLAERSSAPSGVAVAADSDDHLVTMLLTTAGRPLVIVDDDAADDFAERFADDESLDEIESAPAERRAVGLARALQAGALSAHAGPAPRDLAGLKPVLAAHAALAHGRHGAAGALREVLRELYPAALRAYPDPAEHVALAILDSLPEPGLLAAPTTGRNRDTALAVDSVAAQIAASGVTDHANALEAVTALRVAIAETPRRGGVSKHLTSAIATTVRQAVAAVRACDAACAALIATVAERVPSPVVPVAPVAGPQRQVAAAPSSAPPAVTPLWPARDTAESLTRIPLARRSRAPLTPVSGTPVSSAPVSATPAAEASAPIVPTSAAPSSPVPPWNQSAPLPPGFEPTPAVGIPVVARPAAHQHRVAQPAASPQPMAQPQPVAPPQPMAQPQPVAPPQPMAQPVAAARQPAQPVHGAPLSLSMPPVPAQRAPIDEHVTAGRSTTPADTGAPFVPKLTQAVINSSRAERLTAPVAESPQGTLDEQGSGVGAAEVVIPLTRQPAAPETPGSRATWPLLGDRDDRPYGDAGYQSNGYDGNGTGYGGYDANGYEPNGRPPASYERETFEPHGRAANGYERNDRAANGYEPNRYEPNRYEPKGHETNGYETNGHDTGGYDKVTPPWLADDLVLPEPPPLRLVDASALEEPLRERSYARRAASEPVPVSDDADTDGDLLIFSTIRSAWFTGPAEEPAVDNVDEPTWNSDADLGWRAAEHAARPAISEETHAGLPKRVPQANLVPGSPIAAPERPLRIIRDPQRLAQHTSGYFRGWRAGQEVNGYAVGGRPGRESAAGWDFSRDQDDHDDYDYRAAGYGR